MKTWKLVSGILSMILFVIVTFQSCAAGVANSLEANGETSGSAGVFVAILMLAGGIVSVATRNSEKKGGNIAYIRYLQMFQCVTPDVERGVQLTLRSLCGNDYVVQGKCIFLQLYL